MVTGNSTPNPGLIAQFIADYVSRKEGVKVTLVSIRKKEEEEPEESKGETA